MRRPPLVMGIVNVTPDSFSDGGRYYTTDKAVRHAFDLIAAGADILDIGGESTRPGSKGITAAVELDRVLPVIDAVVNAARRSDGSRVPVSIDTQKPEVADEALRRGCRMINDIGAASNPEMIEVLHRHHDNIPIVLMHRKGDPRTMQDAPHYEDVVGEVTAFLRGRARDLTASGIARDRLIVDPGIGFGKRFRDNLELLNHVDSLGSLGYLLLIGASRKRFLGELLNADMDSRLSGNLAVAARCYQQGVNIVRVHDVAETVGLFRVLDAMDRPSDYTANW